MKGIQVQTSRTTGQDSYFFLNAWNDRFDRVSVVGDRKTPNNYSYTKWTRGGLYGTCYARPSSSLLTSRGYLCNASDVEPALGEESGAENAAFNIALSNLNDRVRGSLDLGTDLAEGGQTLRMLSAMTNLVSYARNFRREFGRQPLRAFGSKWLELRYGWLPFVGDIHDAASKLIEDAQNKPLPFSGRGYLSYPCTANSSYSMSFGFPNKFRGTWEHKAEVKVFLLPAASRFEKLAGWTSLNPVSIAWELLPYSFVVDWVVDVGGYIRNLETSVAYRNRFVNGYQTTVSRCVGQMFANGRAPNGDLYDAMTDTYYVRFNRSKLASYPSPRYPSFVPKLGSGRLLNAAALLSQFLRR